MRPVGSFAGPEVSSAMFLADLTLFGFASSGSLVGDSEGTEARRGQVQTMPIQRSWPSAFLKDGKIYPGRASQAVGRHWGGASPSVFNEVGSGKIHTVDGFLD